MKTAGPPAHKHGKSLYIAKLGCPDPACRALVAAARKALRDRRAAERVADENGDLKHPTAPHGTRNGYQNYVCRCVPCCDANSVAGTARRKKPPTS